MNLKEVRNGCKFLNIKEQLTKKFYEFLNKMPNKPEKLRIKFSDDGTNVGNNLLLVNFALTFLEEINCKS